MKKLTLAVAVTAAMAFAVPAFADEIVTVPDPTPNGMFTGEYDAGDSDGDGVNETGTQVGYVAVYDDGVEACNGNEELTRPDDGSALQGYIWVGPNHAANNQTGASPGGEIGAGNNHQDADGNPTGESPCPGG